MTVHDHHIEPGPPCRSCGKELSGAFAINGINAPKDGDVSICVYCGCVSIFTDGSCFREPTDEEINELMDQPEFGAALRLVLQHIRQHEGESDEPPQG